jgi:hypothetical protein
LFKYILNPFSASAMEDFEAANQKLFELFLAAKQAVEIAIAPWPVYSVDQPRVVQPVVPAVAPPYVKSGQRKKRKQRGNTVQGPISDATKAEAAIKAAAAAAEVVAKAIASKADTVRH